MCLLPSVIDAVDVVDVVDADSVDDVLWIPRVERLRQSRRHHRPSHRCCLSHRHQPAPDPLHTFSTFCQILRGSFVAIFLVKLYLSVFLVALLYAGLTMGECQLELLQNKLYSQRQ